MIRVLKKRLRFRLLRQGGFLLAILSASCLLQGCWDEVDLQDVSYVSAIGVDYREGSFIIYAQMIKFSKVAKTDSPQPDPSPVWIGTGKGDTVMLAMQNLTRGGQAQMNIEHLKTLVIQERATSKMNEILDGMNRQRTSRYTVWVFGTKGPIEEVFTTDSFFDQSPLNSIAYTPLPHEEQYSFIRPREMQLAVQSLKEPAMTTTLPVLEVSEAIWKHGSKPLKTQTISGIFVFKELEYKKYMPEGLVKGLRWVDPHFDNFMLRAESVNGKATVAIRSASKKLKATFKEGQPQFAMTVRLEGDVTELAGNMKMGEIEGIIAAQVKQEIESTYKKGLENELDLYELGHHLYRYHLAKWRLLDAKGNWLPREDQLKVKVTYNLRHSGKFELSGENK
ncbi:Ger(x)C family spore germination protein [Paenibacillus harenae]|uniref:Ger(x)C family spore germination protein n=1 Tax=Paenibacillus harenae TaxID=306543 RepID=UPI00041EC1F2|nr:Ger(x)C family spore germination protein [Paenibacillus harenae]